MTSEVPHRIALLTTSPVTFNIIENPNLIHLQRTGYAFIFNFVHTLIVTVRYLIECIFKKYIYHMKHFAVIL